jgi:hypothetical protein
MTTQTKAIAVVKELDLQSKKDAITDIIKSITDFSTNTVTLSTAAHIKDFVAVLSSELEKALGTGVGATFGFTGAKTAITDFEKLLIDYIKTVNGKVDPYFKFLSSSFQTLEQDLTSVETQLQAIINLSDNSKAQLKQVAATLIKVLDKEPDDLEKEDLTALSQTILAQHNEHDKQIQDLQNKELEQVKVIKNLTKDLENVKDNNTPKEQEKSESGDDEGDKEDKTTIKKDLEATKKDLENVKKALSTSEEANKLICDKFSIKETKETEASNIIALFTKLKGQKSMEDLKKMFDSKAPGKPDPASTKNLTGEKDESKADIIMEMFDKSDTPETAVDKLKEMMKQLEARSPNLKDVLKKTLASGREVLEKELTSSMSTTCKAFTIIFTLVMVVSGALHFYTYQNNYSKKTSQKKDCK